MENDLALEEVKPETTPVCKETEARPSPMRTIFRFKGVQDISIDLGKLYKIVYQEGGKTVILQTSPKKDDLSDSIEFETEEAALRGYEQLIGVWARGS